MKFYNKISFNIKDKKVQIWQKCADLTRRKGADLTNNLFYLCLPIPSLSIIQFVRQKLLFWPSANPSCIKSPLWKCESLTLAVGTTHNSRCYWALSLLLCFISYEYQYNDHILGHNVINMALFSSQMTTKMCTMKLPLFTSLDWDSKELEDVIISVITLAQGNSKHTQRVTQMWVKCQDGNTW